MFARSLRFAVRLQTLSFSLFYSDTFHTAINILYVYFGWGPLTISTEQPLPDVTATTSDNNYFTSLLKIIYYCHANVMCSNTGRLPMKLTSKNYFHPKSVFLKMKHFYKILLFEGRCISFGVTSLSPPTRKQDDNTLIFRKRMLSMSWHLPRVLLYQQLTANQLWRQRNIGGSSLSQLERECP